MNPPTQVMPQVPAVPEVPPIPPGYLKVTATNDAGQTLEHVIPRGWHVTVFNGELPGWAGPARKP